MDLETLILSEVSQKDKYHDITYAVRCLVTQSCPPICNPMDRSTRLLCPWDSPGKNTGVGCHGLLQGIFPTQGSNLDLLHCQAESLPLSHLGSPICKVSASRYLTWGCLSSWYRSWLHGPLWGRRARKQQGHERPRPCPLHLSCRPPRL